MRREGRVRGMVRTFNVLPEPLNPRPASRVVNKVDSPPTAGLFVKVSNKPTNHSKFTGKCERPRCTGCHLHPATKSKLKSKGSNKDRSLNNTLDYKVMNWTVMMDDRSDKYPVAGSSASKALGELLSSSDYDHDYDYDYDRQLLTPYIINYGSDYDVEYVYDNGYGYGYDYDQTYDVSCQLTAKKKKTIKKSIVEGSNGDGDDDDDDIIVHGGVTADGDDGYQGFFDIAAVLNDAVVVDDNDDDNEGWTIVGGL